MKIGYYIANSGTIGGVFNYSTGILNLLLEIEEIDKIHLYYTNSQKKTLRKYFDNNKIQPILIKKDRFSFKLFEHLSSLFLYIYYISQKKIKILKKLYIIFNPLKLKIKKIDIFHVPIQTSPFYNFNKIPTIITMHDLQELHFPEFFNSQKRMMRALKYKIAIDEADHIIVSFKHVKDDVIRYFEKDKNKVSVAPFDFSKTWFPNNNFTPYKELRKKYKLSKDFIFYPATPWKHKNHINLIRALKLINKNRAKIELICTKNDTDYFEKIKDEIKKLKLEESIRFLGNISKEDLIGLYYATKLVVIPTLYEAGSGPLFEAMHFHKPVICSNVTSLPETIGNDNFVFDPNNIQEIARMIEKYFFDENCRSVNIEHCKNRINEFKKMDYNSKYRSLYKNIIIDFAQK